MEIFGNVFSWRGGLLGLVVFSWVSWRGGLLCSLGAGVSFRGVLLACGSLGGFRCSPGGVVFSSTIRICIYICIYYRI